MIKFLPVNAIGRYTSKEILGTQAERINRTIQSRLNTLLLGGTKSTAQEVADFFLKTPEGNQLYYLLQPVGDLNITPRVFGECMTHEVRYVGDLCTLSEQEIRDKLGLRLDKYLIEIKDALAPFGLSLGMNIQDWKKSRPQDEEE